MLPIRALSALFLGAAMMFQSWGFIMPHQNPADVLILVNKTNRAPAVPPTLVLPNVQPTSEAKAKNIYMQPVAAAALEELFEAAAEDCITLLATSGFRSYSTQKAIFDRRSDQRGERSANRSVAKPGYSEHQTGLAMDVEGLSSLGSGLVADFGETPEGIWLSQNCHKFGYIIRYPKGKTNITGYIYEPWHIRYVGLDAAAEIAELDITFEEYIVLKRSERIKWLDGGESDNELAK